jgi:hypothetical protein
MFPITMPQGKPADLATAIVELPLEVEALVPTEIVGEIGALDQPDILGASKCNRDRAPGKRASRCGTRKWCSAKAPLTQRRIAAIGSPRLAAVPGADEDGTWTPGEGIRAFQERDKRCQADRECRQQDVPLYYPRESDARQQLWIKMHVGSPSSHHIRSQGISMRRAG